MISRTHHDGKMVSVVIWDDRLGRSESFYRGYFGFTDPKKALLPDEFVIERDLVRMKSRTVAPTLDTNIVLYGFDTAHISDSNVGPDGQKGYGSHDHSRRLWKMENVFESLQELSDEAFAL